MAAKPFWLAPLGLAQLSDLVLEGTSFSIKKQGTTVKRNDTYFMLLLFSNCWLFFHWCFLDSPATFSNFIGLAYSLVFFTHLAFAWSTWQDTFCCAVFANDAMKYKGLVDPKNKPFGNLLPFKVQVIIMFWTHCFMTNDRRTKMNEELTRLPSCLRTAIPMSVAFSFSSGYKRFSSAMENKPYPRFYGCPHCFRRNTQQVSVSVFIYFPSVLFHAYH